MTSGKVVTTVGYERRYNAALQFRDRSAFVEFMLADQPPRPANMANIVAINQGKRPYTTELHALDALSPEQVVRALARDRLILDVREPRAFCREHVPGAYNALLTFDSFEQNVGWILPDSDQPVILAVEHAGQARQAAHKLAFVGLDSRIEGFIEMADWRAPERPTGTFRQIEVSALARALGSEPLRVLDVRETSEWNAGHIEGARFANFKQLPAALDDLGLDPAQPLAVVCAGGVRSSTACSILARSGFGQLRNVQDGMIAWVREGLPTVSGP